MTHGSPSDSGLAAIDDALPRDDHPGFRLVAPSSRPRVAGYRLGDVVRGAGLPWALDHQMAWMWLINDNHDSYRSFVRDVSMAPPRCPLHRDADGGLTVERGRAPSRLDVSQPQAVALLRQEILDATERALRGVSRAGILLSGGLDSSAVAAVAVQAWRGSERPLSDLVAYHRLPTHGPSEVEFARAVARHLGITLVEFLPPIEDPLLGATSVLRASDAANHGSGLMAAYDRMFERMSQDGLRVVLTGDGGDELVRAYGYSRGPDGTLRRSSRLAPWLRLVASRALRATRLNSLRRRRWRHLPPSIQPFARRASPLAWAPAARMGLRGPSAHRDQALRCACQAGILDARRAHGEVRDLRFATPLLDARVTDLAVSLPSFRFAAAGIEKGILREAFRDLLPPRVVERTVREPPVEPMVTELVRPHLGTWEHDLLRRGLLSTSGFLPDGAVASTMERAAHGDELNVTLALSLVTLELWCIERGVRPYARSRPPRWG